MSKEKEIAEALMALKDSDGWKIVEKDLIGSRDQALSALLNPEKADTKEKILHYRATHNAYAKILALIDIKINKGKNVNDWHPC